MAGTYRRRGARQTARRPDPGQDHRRL